MPNFMRRTTLSLRLRVVFSIIMLLIIIGGIFSYLTVTSIHELLEEVMWQSYITNVESLAAFSAKSIANADIAELQRHLDVALAQPDVLYAAARNRQGEIVAAAGIRTLQQSHEMRERIFSEKQLTVIEIGEQPHGLFHSAGHTFLISTAIHFNGASIGSIELAVNTAKANQRLEAISLWGFRLAAAGVFIGTLLLILIDQKLKQNIGRLIETTRQMARGDLTRRVNIKTGDELEQLGESFNMMAEAIKKHEEQLESLVSARTHELAEEKNKLQLILDNVPSAFLMLDAKLHIESASARFESLLGRPRNLVMQRPCALCTIFYSDASSCPAKEARATGMVCSREARLRSADEADRYFEHLAIPIKKNGETARILEVITEITSRKHFEARLVQTERLSAAGQMAAIVAHEIRNSLSSVNLILQMLTDSDHLQEEEHRSLTVAIEAVNRMEHVVRNLLEFARPRTAEYSKVQINDLIEQTLIFCQYQFKKKNVNLQVRLAKELPLLHLDAEHMREAITNVLLNAVEAIEPGGEISVETGQLTLPRTLRAEYEKSAILMPKGTRVVCVRISDSGCGIEPDALPHIFDPFFTTKSKGTGLGLTMTRRVLAEHEGIISVDSEPAAGSTFTIYLPQESQRKNHEKNESPHC